MNEKLLTFHKIDLYFYFYFINIKTTIMSYRKALQKEPTKKEIVELINIAYSSFNPDNIYNAFKDIGPQAFVREELDKKNIPFNDENLRVAFDAINTTFNSEIKIHIIMANFKRCYDALREREEAIEKYKENTDRILKLVKYVETQEQLEKLKELPIFNE